MTDQRRTGTQTPDPRKVDHLRRRLKYFFMNPYEKFHARGQKPWKLMLQILKIAITTFQLVSFGLTNEMMVTFKEENLVFFKHLFLKEYRSHEKNYSIFTSTDVYDHIHFIIERYADLQNLTPGSHAYERKDGVYTPLFLCQEFYRSASVTPGNDTFSIDPRVERECLSISPLTPLAGGGPAGAVNFTLHFERLLTVKVHMKVKAINLQRIHRNELPDCYGFSIMIVFDNRAQSGKIKVFLENHVEINVCKEWRVNGSPGSDSHLLLILLFDLVTILVCLMSLSLCVRSVIVGVQLQLEYSKFVQIYYGKAVPLADRIEFVKGWCILIIICDLLTIAGSVLKIVIQNKELTNYGICSILLGTATMFAWIGVIRFLGFFLKYNILILTLKAAFSDVVRFSLCAIIIYLSYCFCGWIVLGPHHEYFHSFYKVADCLFSLINGDEVYSSFSKLRQRNYLVWLFSRLYIYTFIFIYAYMILSLFIALITDTYETIKQHQQDGGPVSDLQTFLAECKDLPASGRYNMDEEQSSCLSCMCCH
ncbi:mucolipin-3 [Denticeps clupeoides]|uniref:mucolipin-3 n=1 Tax=Denticeps clupeoides TaxID=299321 RepID=UPI0010A42C0C|nr:mucolipin-3-like [Denticeps clupeoides]